MVTLSAYLYSVGSLSSIYHVEGAAAPQVATVQPRLTVKESPGDPGSGALSSDAHVPGTSAGPVHAYPVLGKHGQTWRPHGLHTSSVRMIFHASPAIHV